MNFKSIINNIFCNSHKNKKINDNFIRKKCDKKKKNIIVKLIHSNGSTQNLKLDNIGTLILFTYRFFYIKIKKNEIITAPTVL